MSNVIDSMSSLWILGYDASCSACSQLAKQAQEIAGDKLTVMSLASIDVRQWRATALGDDAP